MIRASEFLREAKRLVEGAGLQSEITRRRAISTAYYGVFHTLTEAGGDMMADTNVALQIQVSRSYNHTALRSVCERLLRQKLEAPWDRVFAAPISQQLKLIAWTVIELQGARIAADYDLSDTASEQFALERIRSAHIAAATFASIKETEEARSFLIAALLSDRWGRRG